LAFVLDTEEGMAVVHTVVDIEDGMAVGIGEGMVAVHTVVDIEEVFVADTETEGALVVRPAVEAVEGNQEDSSADIALEAANIADRVTAVEVDIQD
jgi:hypothetical protein